MKKIFLILFFLLSANVVFAQQEGDRIIAIVGNEVILESDLNYQLALFARQNNLTQFNEQIIQSVFQNMVAEKLMLAKADQDSIIVTEEEVQKQLEYRIKSLADQFGSEKNLEEQYGITIAKIKTMLKEDIRKKMKVDKLKQEKFGSGYNVTRTEVMDFYKNFIDSLPAVPQTFELYQIVKFPKTSDEEKAIARSRAKEILDSIKAGSDFSEMAKKYSHDSASAVAGGDLGRMKKGILVKEFEDAAYLLKSGEVSDLVETQFGYHIIKAYERVGDNIKVQHILIRFPHLEKTDFELINFLKDLKTKVQSGQGSFKEFALLHSDDVSSARDSGYIGRIPATNLDSSEVQILSAMNKGDISDPVRIGDNQDYSYTMFMLVDKYPAHKMTIETDYSLIENYAQNYKEQKELNEWLAELRKTIHVEIKI
ncbi:MAG: parvulin peptidyl-prolyl isomerase [Ignavibacteriae bacterium]|nr:MAG: parvulin peptidyl-prolyl isomerase [Ignavibacteriota bacterium]